MSRRTAGRSALIRSWPSRASREEARILIDLRRGCDRATPKILSLNSIHRYGTDEQIQRQRNQSNFP